MHNYYSTKNQTIIHFLCYKITKNYDFGYAGFKEFRQHISSLTQSNRYLSHIILMRLPWAGRGIGRGAAARLFHLRFGLIIEKCVIL